jgi:VanZ family protein
MLPKVKRFSYYWLPLIAYCVFIYIQSSYPSPESLPSFEFSDKLLHFAAYAVMGVLFYRAYQTLSFKNNIQLLILLSMISASLYGISDEIHQSFVPYRDGSLMDVIADVLGAICGVCIYHWWMMGINRRQRYLKSACDELSRVEVGIRKSEKGKETEY